MLFLLLLVSFFSSSAVWKGVSIFPLFMKKKNKNLFNWSHQVLSLQTYFSASHIIRLQIWGSIFDPEPQRQQQCQSQSHHEESLHWWCWCTFNAQAHPRLGERKWRSLDREWQSDTRREARVKEPAQRMTLRCNRLVICYYSMKIYKVPIWQINIGLHLLKK